MRRSLSFSRPPAHARRRTSPTAPMTTAKADQQRRPRRQRRRSRRRRSLCRTRAAHHTTSTTIARVRLRSAWLGGRGGPSRRHGRSVGGFLEAIQVGTVGRTVGDRSIDPSPLTGPLGPPGRPLDGCNKPWTFVLVPQPGLIQRGRACPEELQGLQREHGLDVQRVGRRFQHHRLVPALERESSPAASRP